MPGYKKPKMGHKKPKMAHGKKPKMAHGKKPQFNAKLKKAAAEGKLDNNPSFKSAVENAKPKMAHGKKPKMVHGNKPKMYGKPKMYNKKPFMMEPGSKEINSPGSFKANEPAMMFKNNMPKQTDKKSKRSGVSSINLGVGTGREKLGNKTYVKPGDTVNVSPDRIDFLVKKKGLRRPKTASDSIALSNYVYNTKDHSGSYDNPRFKRAKESYNKNFLQKNFPDLVAARNKLKIRNVSSSTQGYKTTITPYSKRSGKPKMYGKKK